MDSIDVYLGCVDRREHSRAAFRMTIFFPILHGPSKETRWEGSYQPVNQLWFSFALTILTPQNWRHFEHTKNTPG